jgi:CMP/dCMP kinase
MVRDLPYAVNWRCGATRMRGDRARWDARYAAGDRRHDVGPMALLHEWLSRWTAGRALDVAAGLGRHALLLARYRWTVDAVDVSLEGLRILGQRAHDAGVKINLVLADLDTFACRSGSYDLIVDTFFLDRRLIPRFWRWLRPGGVVFFAAHLETTNPAGENRARRAGEGRYTLKPGEARHLFARWDLLEYAEGPEYDGTRTIATVRLVARRPQRRIARPVHRIRRDVAQKRASIAVAIDGPMGSGKSTVAREVARRLGFQYVDTGAMYRALAVAAIQRGIAPDDTAGLAWLARTVTLTLEPQGDGSVRISVDGDDVTSALRRVEVNRIVARVARVPEVRQALGAIQRSLGNRGGVVMEGRDIGSVILPDARVKVYLTAAVDARARRRQAELAAGGTPMPLDDVQRIIEEDDRVASTREVAPLRVAPGAVVIDSTERSIDQVVDQIVALAERAGGL